MIKFVSNTVDKVAETLKLHREPNTETLPNMLFFADELFNLYMHNNYKSKKYTIDASNWLTQSMFELRDFAETDKMFAAKIKEIDGAFYELINDKSFKEDFLSTVFSSFAFTTELDSLRTLVSKKHTSRPRNYDQQ